MIKTGIGFVVPIILIILAVLALTCTPYELLKGSGYDIGTLEMALDSDEIVMFQQPVITWSSDQTVSGVKIELYKGDELLETIIEEETSGEYAGWSVPRTYATGYDYKIVVTSNDDPALKAESGEFTILTYISFGGSADDAEYDSADPRSLGAWVDAETLEVLIAYNTDSADIEGTAALGEEDILVMKLNRDFTLDSEFGSGGMVRIGGAGRDAAKYIGQTPEGSVYISAYTQSSDIPGWIGGADFLTAKLNSGGEPDVSFDTDGIHIFGCTGSYNDYASNGYIDEAGSYYITGRLYRDTLENVPPDGNDEGNLDQFDGVIGKFDASGQFDTTFDNNGVYLRDDWSLGSSVFDIYVENDGDIFWCGDNDESLDDEEPVIGKMNANGTIDSSFGTAGKTVVSGTGRDIFNSIVVDIDGNIYAAGVTNSTPSISGNPTFGGNDILVAKFLTDGTLDSGFWWDGILVIGGSGEDGDKQLAALSLNKDGRIYVAAASDSDDIAGTESSGHHDFFIVRLNPDGTFDESFDDDGKLFLGGSNIDKPDKIIATESGRVYVCGTTASADIPGLTPFGFYDFFMAVFHE